ncbi:sigma-70 family RNA polymerase sigma factor [Aquimarina sp. BL5]|uniref:RNA polymerase sigma factor n=1 Tax=Aquimarina sp. BL5 TaxID=1714860 RepID=UPI000E4F25B5|nr:sigma-70 family RNA polymerase sigma factor [Aquimarina sp. BL5]AXT52321.1 sigma-70 family RNA polymerase sigma factor [Aquimarina sp. BL5]RKN09993.1 sigma-70 family RNA polymerase sigma factor [Aquimarina sp. BL5]
MNNPKERKILEGIAAGDTAIIKAFYKKNYNYIRGYILQNSGEEEDAEDVFQDALVVMYQKLRSGTLDINVSIRTYFYAICKNTWRSRLRKKKKIIFDDELIEANEESEEYIVEDIEEKEREHVYRKYFLKLSDACKEVLSLVFAGNNMKEIARITGYAEGYARKKKFECKKSLLYMIEEDPVYQELKITSEKES